MEKQVECVVSCCVEGIQDIFQCKSGCDHWAVVFEKAVREDDARGLAGGPAGIQPVKIVGKIPVMDNREVKENHGGSKKDAVCAAVFPGGVLNRHTPENTPFIRKFPTCPMQNRSGGSKNLRVDREKCLHPLIRLLQFQREYRLEKGF